MGFNGSMHYKCNNSGEKKNILKRVIKTYSEKRFASKNPLYFLQNPFVKSHHSTIYADQILIFCGWFFMYVQSPGHFNLNLNLKKSKILFPHNNCRGQEMVQVEFRNYGHNPNEMLN